MEGGGQRSRTTPSHMKGHRQPDPLPPLRLGVHQFPGLVVRLCGSTPSTRRATGRARDPHSEQLLIFNGHRDSPSTPPAPSPVRAHCEPQREHRYQRCGIPDQNTTIDIITRYLGKVSVQTNLGLLAHAQLFMLQEIDPPRIAAQHGSWAGKELLCGRREKGRCYGVSGHAMPPAMWALIAASEAARWSTATRFDSLRLVAASAYLPGQNAGVVLLAHAPDSTVCIRSDASPAPEFASPSPAMGRSTFLSQLLII